MVKITTLKDYNIKETVRTVYLDIISFLASSANLCAADADILPGTPTVHSTYKNGLHRGKEEG